jgi:cytoskeletal protein CcmA (bactofilin family)
VRHRRRSDEVEVREPSEQVPPPGVVQQQRTGGPMARQAERGSRNEGQGGVDPATREVLMERANDRSSEISVVGRGTKIEGKVVAAGSLRVEGEVRGSITARGDVSLSPEGRVEANIEAKGITLGGQVKGHLNADGDVSLPADSRLDGNIKAQNVMAGGAVNGEIVARGRVELGPRARVEGDITSQSLVVAAGAVFLGRSVMGEGRERASAS